MHTLLYLARHGETVWNKQQRFQGQLDSELTEQGELQSKRIATELKNKRIDMIVSSPLGRAVATANLCEQQLKVNIQSNDQLLERHLGDWQGQYLNVLERDAQYDEILRKYTNLSPKGGESAKECGERVYNALAFIAQQCKYKTILVIFHGEALRCFLHFIGVHYTENAYQLFGNGSVQQLSYHHHNAMFEYLPHEQG